MKQERMIRQWMAVLLAAALVWGGLPTGSALAAEGTEPLVEETAAQEPAETTEFTEPTVPGTTGYTEPTAPETTGYTQPTAPETTGYTEPTAPATTVNTQPDTTESLWETTAPEPTQPQTEPTETVRPGEWWMEQMEDLSREAESLEPDLAVLDEFTYRLRELWNAAYDANEEGRITDGELSVLDDMGWAVLDELKARYGYENGALAPLAVQRVGSRETPMAATAENSVATLGSSSGIKFRIFNYTNGTDENGNYIVAGGINDNGLDGWFNFRGTSYENAGPDGKPVSSFTNAVTDIDGYTANHATVLPNLRGGYPVFDGSRDGGPQKSLGYLFGAGGKGVTGYTAGNTLLQLNEKGQYYYDSAENAADFDTASGRFIVRTYRERGKTTASQGTGQYYDFFPFTYWDGTTKADAGSARWYNYENTAEVDYWYGMTMEAAFSMPAGGIVNGSDDMIFSFSGDDDVWVFIDDVLVLDLGGTHGVVSGSINFATGEIKQYLDWNGTGEGSSGTSYPTTLEARFAAAGETPTGGWNPVETAHGKVFADYTEHTIKFFYLERATSCANCKIRFNMPVLPTGKLTVEKELEGAETELTRDAEFGFVLLQSKDGTEIPASGIRFDRIDAASGGVLDTDQTGPDGSFVLKGGQRAEFDLTAGRSFLVRETDTGAWAEALRCSVNEKQQQEKGGTEAISIDPEIPAEVVFVNRLKTTSLQVIKKVAGNMGDRQRLFDFTVHLYGDGAEAEPLAFPNPAPGDAYVLADGGARFQIPHGEEGITLGGIPIGARVVIRETGAEDYETMYEIGGIWQAGVTARISSLTEPVQVVCTNTREVVIETGVALDWAPYVHMLACSGAGILLLRRRPGKKE